MPDTMIDERTTCKIDAHTEHLCYLMDEGFHYGHRQEYKELVKDAAFRCHYCGRTARSAQNLCAPVEL